MADQIRTSKNREAVARAICSASDQNPDHRGQIKGNRYRWQDFLPAAEAALSVPLKHACPTSRVAKARAALGGGADLGLGAEWVTIRREDRDTALAVMDRLAEDLSHTEDILIAAEDRNFEHISALTYEVVELSEQLAELKPDAERYRWLSDNRFLFTGEQNSDLSRWLEGEDVTQQGLDSVIDVAILAETKTTDADEWYDSLHSNFRKEINYGPDRAHIARICYVAGFQAASEGGDSKQRKRCKPDAKGWWRGLDKQSRDSILHHYSSPEDIAKSCFHAGIRHAERRK